MSANINKTSLFFAVLVFIVTGFFVLWGKGAVQPEQFVVFLCATTFGLFMAFNIGGNDVANSFGTSVGAGTLTIRQALVVAAIFEVSGAMIAGGEVTSTIRKGIVDLSSFPLQPMQFVAIMMASLLSAGSWLLFASKKGLPVSTTHSIVGGIVGGSIAAGIQLAGADEALTLVKWSKIGLIAASWVISPLLGGVASFLVYRIVQATVLRYNDEVAEGAKPSVSHKALIQVVPFIAAAGAMIMAGMLLLKGLKHMNLDLDVGSKFLIASCVGAFVWLATLVIARSLKNRSLPKATFIIFSWLQVFTASGFAFSHGSNDIANAIGPFAAVLGILISGTIEKTSAVPAIALLTFGVAMIGGLWFIGKEVINTVGHGLTKIHPASGFAAELAAACVVMIASISGIPVSSTHILIGAVLGIGFANSDANWSAMKPIGMAWAVTLPAAGGASAIFYLLLSQFIN